MSKHPDNVGDSTASLKQKLQAEGQQATETVMEGEDVARSLSHLSREQLEKKVLELEEKAAQAFDQALRIRAEKDNAQRRVERDIENAHKYALEKFVLELLPIIDGLERAITTHETESNGLLDGVNMTLKMFLAALEKFGVEQVSPEQQLFNPELHQAVSTQVDPNAPANTVLSVLQKGYLLNNRLIRPALVVVAKK